ncbi:hypothetical protein MSAN_01961100 [Mycena sanguinolenta]|uniref:Uncharacterized protein n=1 Tax=Mycena sanguinolenta TaxID=230812 RepID=A0A8H6XNQ5_9AGAR|nr:hypothetical protein MSAN_01961100 [Mycena sanguinolenta]
MPNASQCWCFCELGHAGMHGVRFCPSLRGDGAAQVRRRQRERCYGGRRSKSTCTSCRAGMFTRCLRRTQSRPALRYFPCGEVGTLDARVQAVHTRLGASYSRRGCVSCSYCCLPCLCCGGDLYLHPPSLRCSFPLPPPTIFMDLRPRTIIFWIMHFTHTLRLRASTKAELSINDADMGKRAYDYFGFEHEIGIGSLMAGEDGGLGVGGGGEGDRGNEIQAQ